MNIGMSISNYGTRMQYDGIDSYQPIDISEFEEGNYGDVAGQFRTSEWELPLIFRIGFALKPIVSNMMNLTISADALHPNNNAGIMILEPLWIIKFRFWAGESYLWC